MKNRIDFWTFLLVLFCGFTIEGANNFPYHNPTPGEIVIGGCTPIPNGVAPSREQYKTFIDCGFNLSTERGDVKYYREQMKITHNLPLKFLIGNPDLRTDKMKEYVEAFKDSSQLGGWVFIDEPPFNEWKSLVAPFQRLSYADPTHLVLINLLGGGAEKYPNNLKNYGEYLQYFQSLFRPGVWSFDVYPIFYRNKKLVVTYNAFFISLESMRNISMKTNRPFWSFCLGMEEKIGDATWPAATVPYLRFQIFNALAYGAQGIMYWTYGQRFSNANETYLSALVNLKGEKTPAWYAAKQVNSEIKKFNDVFYECKVKDVRHTGSYLYIDTKRLTGTYGPFKMVRSGDAGVLVSLISNKGSDYVVIVNHDVTNDQKISLELLPNKNIVDLTDSNRRYSWRQDVNFVLEKGGYKIFQIIK